MVSAISTAIIAATVVVFITTPAVIAIAVSATPAVVIPVVITPVAAPVPVIPVVARPSVIAAPSIPDNYLVVPVPVRRILYAVIIKMAPGVTLINDYFIATVQIIISAAAGQ